MPRVTTHRSLNKLEFKAHMSIHNKVEVSEGEAHDVNYTRDRFGRKQRVSGPDGITRIRDRKKVIFLFLVTAFAGMLSMEKCAYSGEKPHRSTDVKVESSSVDEAFLNQKIDNAPEEKLTVYKDGDKSVSLNEDGDPNMSLRF